MVKQEVDREGILGLALIHEKQDRECVHSIGNIIVMVKQEIDREGILGISLINEKQDREWFHSIIFTI